jgi:hypothetical protein
LDFDRSSFSFADDLVAFANKVFFGGGLGVAFGVGFGVAFGFGAPKAIGVATGVAFGVGNSISLFAAVRSGCFFSTSSDFNGSGSGRGAEIPAGGAALVSDLSAARSSAPLNQTKVCASGALRAAKLQ